MTTSSGEVEFRAVPAQRVVTRTRTAVGFGADLIGPVVGPMFPEVLALLEAAGTLSGPAVALYAEDPGGVRVIAGFFVDDAVTEVAGAQVHDLEALPQAAVLRHVGPVSGLDVAWTTLMAAVEAAGLQRSGAGREVYLTPPDRPQEEWVTQLVQPVATPS